MNSTYKTVLASLITIGLIGCGGSSSSGDNGKNLFLSGKVIDGYIVGATVFLDLNFNGVLEANEPSVVTEGKGDFDLAIPSKYTECSEYVPVVVDVPVGAIDLDYPDTPIENAYQMTIAPQFTRSNNEDLLNLTPLTTIVWQAIEIQLKEYSGELSCEKILAEEELRSEIKSNLQDQERRVAYRYNITVDELYGDYVESGDTELHGFAQALVVPLQKSYAETVELQEANPEADFAYVEYFTDLEASSYDVWYRSTFVQTSNGNLESKDEYLDGEWKVTGLRERWKKESFNTEEEFYQIDYKYSINEAGLTSCAVRDEWNVHVEESVGIVTTFNVKSGGVSENMDWDACYAATAENLTESNATYELNYTDFDLESEVPLNFGTFAFSYGTGEYSHLVGHGDEMTTSELDALYATFNTRDLRDTEDYGSRWWSRMLQRFDDFDDENITQIMLFHTAGGWARNTYFKDGTHLNECGLTEADLSEDNCYD
ncbi:hypothetical protein EKG38_14010 [Shewanella canadensis]|uniref:Uncharacterized protein n=1 Tax=Shewanella canadensis TaxID=271096 RepID=A0A3S0K9L9_9GAMM|nr:hypothetical protein [Shewanella canadensis]RTR38614.1 hypothetical protein EKG38_14010 [Shewanella canadensis]